VLLCKVVESRIVLLSNCWLVVLEDIRFADALEVPQAVKLFRILNSGRSPFFQGALRGLERLDFIAEGIEGSDVVCDPGVAV